MGIDNSPRLKFEIIKEPRKDYFVEYLPPDGSVRFAHLTLVFHNGVQPDDAKVLMEKEAEYWLNRYPIPVMVFSSDEKDDPVQQISTSIDQNNLIAWKRPEGQYAKRWDTVKDKELPEDALSVNYLLKVYNDVNFKTIDEIKAENRKKWLKRSKELRMGIAIIFVWAVVVPAGIAVLGWASPIIGALATAYSLGKAGRKGALMMNWIEPSTREKEKRDEDRRKDHYFYHCERNPEGFLRLRAENIEKEERERIQREAEEIGSLK